jgi:DNA-binding MarR family transcriptional regulator
MTPEITGNTTTPALAELLFDLTRVIVKHADVRLNEAGITARDYWVLRNLDEPIPMNSLATFMNYDPSHMTALADRLEGLGLIERQPHPTDRRIKNLALTAKGRRLKASLPSRLWGDIETFSALTEAEQLQLVELLGKVAATQPPENGH